jgi:hypothetical protein
MALETSLAEALRMTEAAMRKRNIVAIHISTEDDVYDPRGKVELTAYLDLAEVDEGNDAPREFRKCDDLVSAFEDFDFVQPTNAG